MADPVLPGTHGDCVPRKVRALPAELPRARLPTTYNLASAEPKIAVGHLLLPWATDVVPDWGP